MTAMVLRRRRYGSKQRRSLPGPKLYISESRTSWMSWGSMMEITWTSRAVRDESSQALLWNWCCYRQAYSERSSCGTLKMISYNVRPGLLVSQEKIAVQESSRNSTFASASTASSICVHGTPRSPRREVSPLRGLSDGSKRRRRPAPLNRPAS
jgi:hypothetical protein